MQLRITDGTTTIDLSGSTTGIKGVTYFPTPGDGQDSVSETAELVGSGTEAQIRSAANAIERLLEDGRRRRRLGVGPRVFLEYKPVTSDTLWRTEVFDGRIVWSGEPGARQLRWSNPAVRYALLLTRTPWWEGPETELPLSAIGQSAALGGRTITNDGIANWVQIAATQVAGTLPAPLRLRLSNNAGAGKWYRDLFVGVNAFGNPTAFGHILQGEGRVAGYGMVQSNAACSGGQFVRLSVGTSGSHTVMWLLPSAMMAAGGRWFRLLLRMAPPVPSYAITMRPSLWDASGTTQLWIGQAQALPMGGIELHNLGAIPVPPGAWDTSYGSVRLALWMHSSGGTQTVDVDYMALLGMDAWRQLVYLSGTVADGDSIEADDIEGRLYSIEGGSKYPYVVGRGEPLVVYPNVTQRLCIVEMLATGSSPISDTFSVQAWYRPRRSTV